MKAEPQFAREEQTPVAGDLNQRQLLFIEHYARHGNGTRAAIEAGYSPTTAARTASRLRRNRKVVRALDELRGRVRAETLVTTDRVLRGLLSLAEDKQNTPPNVRRQAWVNLGTHLGMFVHRLSFTEAQLDAAAAAVAGEYELEGMEDLIAAEADRILREATRQQGRVGPPRYRGRGPAR